MSRHRILFIAEAVTLAHVSRAYTLAKTLDPARYDVHAAWDPRYNSLLGELSFPFRPISSLPTEEFLQRVARGAPMHDAKTLSDYVDEDVATIRDLRPDVVVGDFRLSLAASARLTKVKHVAVANAYWSPYARQTFHFPEYDYPLSGLIGHRVARLLFDVFRPLGFAAHTRPLNKVLRKHRLPEIGGDIRTMYTFGDRTAYADIPELIPLFEAPETHTFIGAVLWSPKVPVPAWWSTLSGDRPIVYATPGSSGDGEMLSIVLDALSNLPVTVIAATAGRSRVAPLPANACTADYLPGTDAAARASLVICNGGSPTTNQALAAGVPVLALASNNMDQHLNMQAVRRSGAGEVLRARGVNPSAVRHAVERLMESPGYRPAAERLAAAHARTNAAERFPALIERLVEG
jgi:UDP:flavonoid glycosyltransferase YjiC (YdhE family)